MPASNLLLASKIVVVEEPPSIRNIPGVETSVAAFEGVTERGPVRVPQFHTSWDGWVDTYGGFIANSDLPMAVQGAFLNGATAVWTSRVVHYTDILDNGTQTAVAGTQNIPDRGGAAAPATLDSVAGPFTLLPGQDLVVDIDNTGPDTLTLAATSALNLAANSTPYALTNGDTLVYRVADKITGVLDILRTITFTDTDPLIGAIGAATTQELVNFINRDGIGIGAEDVAGAVRVFSDAKGTGAALLIDASSTAISAGKLNMTSGTTNGTGNVALIDAVTAVELAALLTALPLSAGTAVAVAGVLRLTGVTTGVAGEVEITAATTALGIFTGALPITINGSAAAVSNTITVAGKTPGTWINSHSILIEAASSSDADRFNLRIVKGTSTQEVWPNLSMDALDERYVEAFIDANSKLIIVTDLSSPATPPADSPALGTYSTWLLADDGLVGLVDSDFTGSDAGDTGLFAFDLVDNITLVSVPGRATSAVHNTMLQYCEVQRAESCFAVLGPPAGLDEQGIKTYVETTALLVNASEFAAIYWPRVEILNPSTAVFGPAERIVVPPEGHIIGMYARTDASLPGGVYQAPANVERGRLFGVLGFESDETKDERKRDVVYPSRINPITTINGSPIHVDGSRTLKSNGNFPSIPERRGVIFIAQSLKQGLLFVKHRNNDRRLRMEAKRAADAFLLIQFGVEAFRGDTPAESFFVDVSDAVNPIELIFAGQMVMRIGLATQKPLDFLVIKITQDTRAFEERLAAELG